MAFRISDFDLCSSDHFLCGFSICYTNVYWKTGSSKILPSLDSGKSLLEQLGDAFSMKEFPIWMDNSTTAQCREIEKACAGEMELARVTQSCRFERFTGPRIKKISQTQPEVYDNTKRISRQLLHGYLLIGAYAAVDHVAGADMNLMDIK